MDSTSRPLRRRGLLARVYPFAGLAVLPFVLLAPAAHGAARAALFGAAVAAAVAAALAVRRVVRDADRRADDLRQSEEAIATVARELTSGPDARDRICKAALEITGARGVSLRQPDGRGYLVSAAHAGLEDLPPISADLTEETSCTALAFTTGRRLIVSDTEKDHIISPRLLDAWPVRSLMFEPILRGDEPAGVLVIGWDEPISDLSDWPLSSIQLLAAEAAMAIERSELQAELEAAARTDPLTGLGNRRVWEEELPRELARAARYGRPVSVALLDLDYFKPFNDEHGHQAGDLLLKNAAAAWADQLRDVDLLVRVGGDEFAALLPGAGLDDAFDVVERLRGATPGATCSAGLACWDGIEDATGLLSRADQALYTAKGEGRDRTSAPSANADPA